jgi:hypothetical protein
MKIIVRQDKDDTLYFDASTQRAIDQACLKILHEAIDYFIIDPRNEHFDKAKKRYENAQTEFAALKETVTNPDDSVVYNAARTALRTARNSWTWWETALEQYEAAKAADEAQDAAAAFDILTDRSDNDEEGFEVVTVWSANG